MRMSTRTTHSPLPSVVMPMPLLHTAWNSAAGRGRGFSSSEDELIVPKLEEVVCDLRFKGGFYPSSWRGRGSRALRSRAQD